MSLDALKAFFSEDNTTPKETPKEDKKEQHTPILTARIEREKKSLELFKHLQDNIKKSERLRCKINKDILANAPVEVVLRDCIECISLMTGDTVFYEQNIKKIKI
jgi:RNA binding exosome subunit